jgi:hypothetical protein
MSKRSGALAAIWSPGGNAGGREWGLSAVIVPTVPTVPTIPSVGERECPAGQFLGIVPWDTPRD